MAKEFCLGAVGLELELSLLIGVNPLPESATALNGAPLRMLDGACESCGLPRGVGGNFELDKPWDRHHASSNVAGDRLQP